MTTNIDTVLINGLIQNFEGNDHIFQLAIQENPTIAFALIQTNPKHDILVHYHAVVTATTQSSFFQKHLYQMSYLLRKVPHNL